MDQYWVLFLSKYARDIPYLEMMPGREIISTEQYEMFNYYSRRECSRGTTQRSAYIINDLQRHYESNAPYQLLTSGKNSFESHMKFLVQVAVVQRSWVSQSRESDINFIIDLRALKKLYNIMDCLTDFRTITMARIAIAFCYFPAVTYHFISFSGEFLLPTELSNFPCSMKVVNFMTLIPKKGVKVSYRTPISTPATDTLINDWRIVIPDKNEVNQKNEVASNQKKPNDFILKDVVLNEEDKILMGKAVYAYALKVDRQEELLFGLYNAHPLLQQCLEFYELWLPDEIRYDYLREMNLIELRGYTIKLRETVKRELLLMITSERSCRDFHY